METRKRMSILQKVRSAQHGNPPIQCVTEIPRVILKDCDKRLGIEMGEGIPLAIADLYGHFQNLLDQQTTTNDDYLSCIRTLKLLAKLLNLDNSQEYPSLSGQTRESRIIHAEVICLFGGVEVIVQLVQLPQYYPVVKKEDSRLSKGRSELSTRLTYHALDVLHFMCNCMGPDIAGPLSDREDFIFYLFSLMSEKSCFLKAATLLEDILGVKQTMIALDKIPKLDVLVSSFSEEQVANFCRVLSIAVSDTEGRDEQPNLVAQDKANRKRTGVPISELNQEILVGLPNFVKNLVKIACKRIDTQSSTSIPNLFQEIETWVTWLDGSLAFDALAEVSQEQVFLNFPPYDPTAPIPQSLKTMHELVYKVEVLYVLCLLLTGKQRTKVHEMLAKYKLMAGLNLLFDNVIWRCNLQSQPLHGHNENCDCSPEVALKVQFLRLVHSFCDQNENKYLILTRNEINDLNRISSGANIPPLDAVRDIDKSLLCTGQKGILTKLVDVLKKEPAESPFRFWMSRSIESFLRGKTSFTDQTFLLRKGLLEAVLTNIINTGTKSKEVLQSNFDLLAELMKFNHIAFKRFNKFIDTKEKLESFLKLVTENIVDSNMFIRCLILTLDHFEREQPDNYEYAMRSCSLLQFIYKRDKRINFLIKLINSIRVENLTQENVSCLNTTIIFLMFAERSCELPEYLSGLRNEEQSLLKPGFLLQNFRELVFFWIDHYLNKDKDSTQLERSSCIPFSTWKVIANMLVGNNVSSLYTIAHYLHMDDLMTKDMEVDLPRTE